MQFNLNKILIIFQWVLIFAIPYLNTDPSALFGLSSNIILLLMASICSMWVNLYVKNPFLEFFNTFFFIFFIFRIPFLLDVTFSSDLNIRPFAPENTEFLVNLLIFHYLSIVGSILIFNPTFKSSTIVRYFVMGKRDFRNILLFVLIIVFLNFFKSLLFFDIHGLNFSSFTAIFFTIFSNQNVLAVFMLSIFFATKENIRSNTILISLILVVSFFEIIYTGSKSSLLHLILIFYMAYLLKYRTFQFPLKYLYVFFALIPLIFITFLLGKLMRWVHMQDDLANNFEAKLASILNFDLINILDPVTYRIGYLDFYLEKISNEIYHPYISLNYYFKAFIDKITPGFDVYGVPFASRAVYNVREGASEVLNSELITVFAESHLIFGSFSVFFYLFIAYLLQQILKFNRFNSFASILFNYFVLFSFYWWLTGSGLDMVTALVIYQAIFILFVIMYLKYFKSSNIYHKERYGNKSGN